MGFGGGGDEAKKAREDEQRRQERIRAGTQRVNAIFDGGTYRPLIAPTGKPLDMSTGQYFDANGKRLTGKFGKFDNEVVYGAAKKAPAQFNDKFFDNRRQAYIDYADPQLEDQYGKAQKELTFALARSGLMDSSARAQKTGDLQQLYSLNKQQIADEGLSHSTQARNAVEDARANLIATLNATGDAEGAANAAITRASALSQPAAYSPLAQLFSDFTAGLGTQAALERANYYSGGQTPARYSTGLFTPRTGSVKVS